MTFKVRQKVVCINAKGGFINLCGEVIDSHELTEGAVYTIRSIGMFDSVLAVRLKEIVRRKLALGYKPQPGNNWDQPFRASRFRPLVERKTDISIFTEMLLKVEVT